MSLSLQSVKRSKDRSIMMKKNKRQKQIQCLFVCALLTHLTVNSGNNFLSVCQFSDKQWKCFIISWHLIRPFSFFWMVWQKLGDLIMLVWLKMLSISMSLYFCTPDNRTSSLMHGSVYISLWHRNCFLKIFFLIHFPFVLQILHISFFLTVY